MKRRRITTNVQWPLARFNGSWEIFGFPEHPDLSSRSFAIKKLGKLLLAFMIGLDVLASVRGTEQIGSQNSKPSRPSIREAKLHLRHRWDPAVPIGFQLKAEPGLEQCQLIKVTSD